MSPDTRTSYTSSFAHFSCCSPIVSSRESSAGQLQLQKSGLLSSPAWQLRPYIRWTVHMQTCDKMSFCLGRSVDLFRGLVVSIPSALRERLHVYGLLYCSVHLINLKVVLSALLVYATWTWIMLPGRWQLLIPEVEALDYKLITRRRT